MTLSPVKARTLSGEDIGNAVAVSGRHHKAGRGIPTDLPTIIGYIANIRHGMASTSSSEVTTTIMIRELLSSEGAPLVHVEMTSGTPVGLGARDTFLNMTLAEIQQLQASR